MTTLTLRLIAAIIFVVFIAHVAFAQERIEIPGWADEPPFVMTLTPGEAEGHVATLHIQNELVPRKAPGPQTDIDVYGMTLGDLAVSVTVEATPGTVPDTIRVDPPDDLVAVPASITIDEGTAGEIRLLRADVIPMG